MAKIFWIGFGFGGWLSVSVSSPKPKTVRHCISWNFIHCNLLFSKFILGGANMACAYATSPPKWHFGGGVAIFLNILKYTYRMTMIRCALERPDLGQAFRHPICHHITRRKFSRGTWSWRISQKLMKLRNFETHIWLWRAKYSILHLLRGVASLLCNVRPWFDVR